MDNKTKFVHHQIDSLGVLQVYRNQNSLIEMDFAIKFVILRFRFSF